MTKNKNVSKPKSEKNQVQEQATTNDIASQKTAEDLKGEGTEEAVEPETSIENIDVQEESIEDGLKVDQLEEIQEAISPYGVTDESQEQFKNSEQDFLQKVKEDQDEDLNAGIPIVDKSKESFGYTSTDFPKGEPIIYAEDGPFPSSEILKKLAINAPLPEEGVLYTIDHSNKDQEDEDFDELEELIETNQDVVLPNSSEFTTPLPATERAHVDAVLKSVNESTAILRKKVILYQDFVAALPDSNEKEALDKKLSELHQ